MSTTNLDIERSPIHQDEGGWWFWIETWADRHGPYTSKEEAKTRYIAYCDWLAEGILPNPKK